MLKWAVSLSLILLAAGMVLGAGTEENIALHKKVTVSPQPNYRLTKDRDPAQLTDGIYASTRGKWNPDHRPVSIWTKPGTLGWVHRKPVIITIDLGKVQPISGLIYSTAGGRAGVEWPKAIYVTTSDDGTVWHYAGDLVALSKEEHRLPPAKGLANFRYVTRDLHTHGRYVELAVEQEKLIFTDEVEVLRGNDALLKQSAGKEVPPMTTFAAQQTITSKAQHRMNADIASVRKELESSDVPAAQKRALESQLDHDAAAVEQMAPLKPDFKTTIPLTPIHRDILAVHGQALAARGFEPLTLWKIHRYAWRPLVEVPTKAHPAQIDVSLLEGAIRPDSLLLTNATGKAMKVGVRVARAPSSARPGWIRFDSAIWTDAKDGTAIQDALMPMVERGGAYTMEIPAGLTGKLWVTIDASKLPAGDYSSELVFTHESQQITAPVHVHVSSIAMGKPRLSLMVWDYTNADTTLAETPKNRAAGIKLMRSHFVDSPWATRKALPTPRPDDFDADNRLTAKLDFSNLDQWVARWPDARQYMVFYNVKRHGTFTGARDSFGGAKMGTPAFRARIGSWMNAVLAHWRTLGLQPSQLVLLLVDEPYHQADDQYLVPWADAIKAAAPKVRILSNPIWRDPTESRYPKAFLLPDILCLPHEFDVPFYEKLQREHDKTLYLYNGPGLHHTGDPQLQYRQMAWRVFSIDGRGEGFWAFFDTGGVPTSWNAYTAAYEGFAPGYIDKDTVYNSIHWDATREGVEDFQVLSLLRDAIEQCDDPSLKSSGRKVLNGAVQTVNDDAQDNKQFVWSAGSDPFVVDSQLERARSMLVRLDGTCQRH